MLAKVEILTDAERARLQMSRATSSKLKVPHVAGRPFMPFQLAGIDYANATNNILNADPPGLGKTYQSIGFMNYNAIRRAMIFAPASLIPNWRRELDLYYTGDAPVSTFHPKTFDASKFEGILLVPYSFARIPAALKLIHGTKGFPLAVADECHLLKNGTAAVTKAMFAKNGWKSRADLFHGLSGSPFENKPVELYGLATAIDKDALSGMSYSEFGHTFCDGKLVTLGRRDDPHAKRFYDFKGSSNLTLLSTMLRSKIMVRRKKREVLPQLPNMFPPNVVYLAPGRDGKSAVKSLKTYDDDFQIRKAMSPGFTEWSRARADLGVAKAKAAVDYIQDQLDAGHEKIVVFFHHKEAGNILEEAFLKFGSVRLDGSISAQAKDAAVQKFQNHKQTRIMLASILAAGLGHTMTASSYAIFVEFDVRASVNMQAIERLWRLGQTKGVQVDYLMFENSVDIRMFKIQMEKERSTNEFYD